ncbi:MAG: dihydroorotate dehydrogenase electron transfer subunit [Deltaproteobacteria bacterium HGW-Deltaproteobacteria-7]|jgi:dihydroorotate dehydrogenase electron transfer subunit|nr:MAG: dihydroorotate dehydrogenase electron transfer subunit [Deltaproteobacteria bacterium HGW-Deltaproteobacteria-7]PKN20953.1 MAG: dihydroorotate dehydrogenase electron transfer subunit [Deltaproteobacteria bacterium HGW-Deltaproteobacteria-6]
MAKDIYIGEVSANEEIQIDCFLMKVKLPLSFTEPLPGQFVMIRIAGLHDPFLSRPISIYAFSRGKSHCTLDLLYRVVGKGTQILAGLIKGSQVEISGPLGGSYSVEKSKKKMVLIAGGIGVAPLSLLAQYLCRTACHDADAMTFYLGAQTANAVVGLDHLRKYCYKIIVCTDDGTLGEKSLVTKAFQKDIKKYEPARTAVYACGPRPMLRSLSAILDDKYFCQVSLEERMACGVGACVGCAVAVKDDQGRKAYKRVCADGPVFDLQKVIWE